MIYRLLNLVSDELPHDEHLHSSLVHKCFDLVWITPFIPVKEYKGVQLNYPFWVNDLDKIDHISYDYDTFINVPRHHNYWLLETIEDWYLNHLCLWDRILLEEVRWIFWSNVVEYADTIFKRYKLNWFNIELYSSNLWHEINGHI